MSDALFSNDFEDLLFLSLVTAGNILLVGLFLKEYLALCWKTFILF